MKRKGDLLSTVLGVVLMVLGIAVFIFGITKLYSAHVDQESENAKHIIDLVIKKIEALPDEGSTQVVLQGFPGAENWYIVGWSKASEERPSKCFFSDCLCICKDDKNHEINSEHGITPDSCQTSGFCRRIDLPPSIEYYYPELISGVFKTGVYVPEGSSGRDIAYQRIGVSCIPLASNLFDFTLKKTSGNYGLKGSSDFISWSIHCPGFRYIPS